MTAPTEPDAPGTVRTFGDAALVVTVADAGAARDLAARVRAGRWPQVVDVVGGLCTVTVHLAHPGALDATVVDRLAAAAVGPDPMAPKAGPHRTGAETDGAGRTGQAGSTGAGDPAAPGTVVIETEFDGPDLSRVAGQAGLDRPGLVAALTGADLSVAMIGFSPGFAYLAGLPRSLAALGRRPVPRPAVPAGSVALAAGFATVYPQATPGGWWLVGRTARRLFDPTAPPYALLAPGDRVRFAAARAGSVPATTGRPAPDRPPLHPPPGSRPGLVVEAPGTLTTVQDGGRAGRAHLGVPGSGPADRVAHALANRLVGNADAAAAFEITGTGPVLVARGPLHLAVVGATDGLRLDGFALEPGAVVPVGAGQRLAVGTVARGLRATLAVAGGLATVTELSSASSDLLSGLGPGRLRPGDELGVGPAPATLGGHLGAGVWTGLTGADAGPGRDAVLRVLAGPHPGWFGDGALDELARRRFTVAPESNRVGVRLTPADGAGPLTRRHGELEPQAMVRGAIQLTPGGGPIVLGPDHATTGGYPVLAVVIWADLARLGRLGPGDGVRFAPVDRAGAARAWADLAQRLDLAVVGRYPTATA